MLSEPSKNGSKTTSFKQLALTIKRTTDIHRIEVYIVRILNHIHVLCPIFVRERLKRRLQLNERIGDPPPLPTQPTLQYT